MGDNPNTRQVDALAEARAILAHGDNATYPSMAAARQVRRVVKQVVEALEQSVKLQSHYAELLNMHDGGERLTFASADAWMERLASLNKQDAVSS